MTDQKIEAKRKLQFLEREFWQARNGKRSYLRCPYCRPFAQTRSLRRNYVGRDDICCATFLRALWAIMDRQDQIDEAQRAAVRALLADHEETSQRHLVN